MNGLLVSKLQIDYKHGIGHVKTERVVRRLFSTVRQVPFDSLVSYKSTVDHAVADSAVLLISLKVREGPIGVDEFLDAAQSAR